MRLILPAGLIALLTVLVLVPVGFMFVGATLSGGLVDPSSHWTLDKLAEVYASAPYLQAIGSTVAISALVGVIATVAGVALAWLIARTDLPVKPLLEGCVIAPLFLSPFIGAIAWLILGSPKAGLINAMAQNDLGLPGPLIDVATPTGIILIMALYYVPYAYLTVVSSLRGMDPALEEASYLNGSGILKTALRVTLPVVRPAVLSAFFFVFVLSAGTFAIPAVLDRGSHIRFLAVDIFQASATYPIDYGKSAAIGTVLFWIALAGIVCYRWASHSAGRFVTVTARGFRPRLARLRVWRIPAITLVLLYLLLAIVLPYLALIYAAFTSFSSGSIFAAPWTLRNAWEVASAPEVLACIRNTIEISLIAPTLCLIMGVLLAYAVRRMRIGGRRVIDYLAMFPIAVPGIVLGTGVFWTYILTPIYGTIWVLVVAFITSYLPFAYRISDTALIQIDRPLEEASSLCGASRLRTVLQITTPLMRPALLSAWIMVFIFSVREISAAILLASSDNVVLSVLSWNYLDYGDVPKAAVVGLLQTVILILGVAVGRFAFRVRLTRAI